MKFLHGLQGSQQGPYSRLCSLNVLFPPITSTSRTFQPCFAEMQPSLQRRLQAAVSPGAPTTAPRPAQPHPPPRSRSSSAHRSAGCCQQGCEHGPRLLLQDLRLVKLHHLGGGERRGGERGEAELGPEGSEGLGAILPAAWGCPLTFPLPMTRMRSQLRMVVTRCAMISTVQPRKLSRIVCWMRISVSKSREAVASSIRMIWWIRNRGEGSLLRLDPGSSPGFTASLPSPSAGKRDLRTRFETHLKL